MCYHGHMHEKDCNGRCAGGILIAIIFGALFLWFIVQGYMMQRAGTEMLTVYGYYFVSLIFLAITICAKKWALHCGCGCAVPAKPTKPIKKK